ncbi:hypothetical protein [Plasmodium yoelii yoelii]|uniref:Uncharacterized protein n=1 Tax=Plasmodium yoelii yoelii TaxID=73239 RepID=Q7RNM3_PLAYO|nr:hypothetical protein [Plasmodium yoelii yoelii]
MWDTYIYIISHEIKTEIENLKYTNSHIYKYIYLCKYELVFSLKKQNV